MPDDEEDFPVSYLFYALAVIAVIGGFAVGGIILLVR